MIIRRKIIKRTAINGYEEDAFYARHYYNYRPKVLKFIKRKANKRMRQVPFIEEYNFNEQKPL